MYEWNYFYGAIMLDRDYDEAVNFIENKLLAKNYYYFHPKIFSTAVMEYPFYYDNILISFGRTGKWLFYGSQELMNFIVEFEDILNNLDFENAQIKMTSPLGNYTLFWRNKQKCVGNDLQTTLEYFNKNKTRYYESRKFFFGLGEINLSTGGCIRKYNEDDLKFFDDEFPDFKYETI
jgi:hypothetical protein